eukprot:Nitzschia sp. Nitz4//scaffold41_size133979//19551//23745//NITZ4_003331-RA/size133979-snap-gene-0.97-mRNA-1//1//CDS//3329551422//6341//frame0
MSGKDELNRSSGSQKDAKEKKPAEQASVGETLSFVFNGGDSSPVLFGLGFIGAIGNGAVFPILAYLFSTSFSDIAGASTEGLAQVRELAYTFMIVGSYALLMATIQTTCFETVAYNASKRLRLEWFRALIRQDPSFFDVHDIGGIASSVGPSVNRYRRGLGRKFGEGIQFTTTSIGGIGYAFYANWSVALVVMCVVPVVSFCAIMVITLNQSKTKRAAAAYSRAGSVAYSTVSGIKTVLSLNAVKTMLKQYGEATQEALQIASSMLVKQGLANGGMLGSFLTLYAVLCLYGTYLLYSDIEDTGCDPSDSVPDNMTCDRKGSDVFGAMLGIAFAAQGAGQIGNFLESFSAAKSTTFQALKAINRKVGSKEEVFYQEDEEDKDSSTVANSTRSSVSQGVLETSEGKIKAILPKYEIDSTSDAGLKPDDVHGRLTFENVKFRYPTRPAQQVLKGFSIDIEAGKTIAFVGPSGGGKSTVVKMLERFYDPVEGSVSLDGVNIKDYNVKHLRSMIGYVGQEPTLFATSIAANIRHGNPAATQEQIEEAARLANAHDFISSLTDGYETQVGDKGSQLSGGQKQRIAIARVLVGNPKILLLDEATSALDNESELVVQEALDNVMAAKKRTTVIIAHRLSTIRNADIIAVVQGGVIVETGTHDELLAAETGYYRSLVQKQAVMSRKESRMSSAESSGDLEGDEDAEAVADGSADTMLEFKHVSFSYPTRPNKQVLKHFNIQIKKGETVALVGTSGGGKSTTVAMIERFYDPSEGSVEYKGVDVKTLNVAWYRDQIGYVGQEPTLFNETIANNIAYGYPEATREEIEEAAKQANAYDFIMGFPEGFDTHVGEGGGQLSGGQKQRVAIARALVKKPEILLLDEATSALDNESEAIVQAALDKLMESKNNTCIVIAHRLTTIQNADRIAFIADGHVKEFGTHEELIQKDKGRYRRLVESQERQAKAEALGVTSTSGAGKEDEEIPDWEKQVEEEETGNFNMARARSLASPDLGFIAAGSVGALMAGSVFPVWGILFSKTMELLFSRVLYCTDDYLAENGYVDCQDYWSSTADHLRERSYLVALMWASVAVGCIVGNVLAFWGFGQASEHMNKRVRDSSFRALVRQEVAFFDKRSVGKLTSQLEDDAARLHTFTGEPIRAFLIAISSVVTGVVLSFVYMWPFAVLAILCVPLMGFATSMEMKRFTGQDGGSEDESEGRNTPGGIIVETLLNITTVSALTMEEVRYQELEHAMEHAEPNHFSDGFTQGFMSGLAVFIQQWINGLQIWFGGWLLFNYPDEFAFTDFLIANFSILFSLFGLGTAFQDISDRKETELAASRIFFLLDRESTIDPLSDEGKKLN